MFPYPTRQLLLLLMPLGLGLLMLELLVPTQAPILSRWSLATPLAAVAEQMQASLPQTLSGRVMPLGQLQPGSTDSLLPEARLLAFNQASKLQERVADGRVEFFRRDLAGGELVYFVVRLDEQVHVQLINADGAIPASDEHGDTIWLDHGQHLATVATMANAPYATIEGMELLGALAFGFHGDLRTSNEGSVVINSVVHRVNAGRAALCLTAGGRALIDRFDAQALQGCTQAVGGGPVILWRGLIANPAVNTPAGEYLPFNPLGEDFVQLDWRITVYNGTYPKTAVCVGDLPGGRAFLVLANSSGVTGIDFARALRDMGCSAALGGDDDSSTQAVWRGQPIWPRPVRPVPDAIAVYQRR